MSESITVVIPSYKSKKRIIKHIKNISKKIKIIIIENSADKNLKEILEKKNKNISVFLQKNIGYGRAINLASKFVKTKFFFVINPDTTIYKDTIKKLVLTANKVKNFGAMSPNLYNKKKNIKGLTYREEKNLNGGAMLFKTKIFKKLNGFDENIFLYYEDNDYFTKCRFKKVKLYTALSAFFFHKKRNSSSATFKNQNEKKYASLINAWHGQWSKFYYMKKYKGYLFALYKSLPRLILMIFQLILNFIINYNKSKFTYFKIEGLFCSIIGLKSFKRTKYDKDFSIL